MSIASLSSIAYERDTGHPWRTRGQPATAADTEAQTVQASRTEVLVSFIPTEILTGYLAAVAAVAATTSDSNPKLGLRWGVLGLFGLLTPLTVLATWRDKRRADEQPGKRGGDPKAGRQHMPLLEMVAATGAFAIWAVALPSTPITAWRAYDRAYSVVAVIVGGALLTLLAQSAHRHSAKRLHSGRHTFLDHLPWRTRPSQPHTDIDKLAITGAAPGGGTSSTAKTSTNSETSSDVLTGPGQDSEGVG